MTDKQNKKAPSSPSGETLFGDLFRDMAGELSLAQEKIVVYRRNHEPPRYDFITPTIEELTGYPPSVMTPALWDSLVEQTIFPAALAGHTFREGRGRYLAGEVHDWHAECLVRHRDGTRRWVLDLSVPLRDHTGRVISSFGFLHDITPLREGLIRDADPGARLKLLARHLPAIIWTVDTNLCFTSSEGAGLVALGLRPGQMVGKTLGDFFKTNDPEFPSIVAHRRALQGISQDYEQTWSGRNYIVHLEPVRDAAGAVTGVLGLATDVTLRRDAEAKLMAREAYVRALLQAIPDLIAVIDTDGNYVDFKADISPQPRPSPDAVIGRNLHDMGYDETTREKILSGVRRAVETGVVVHIEYPFQDDSGQTWWDARISRLDARHAIVAARNITERKRSEEQLRGTQQLESLGVLAGGIAHDFNNLLVGITGNAELAQQELPVSHPAHEHISELRRAAARAAELTNLMLAYAGRGRFQTAAIDLNALAQDVAQLAHAAISKKIRFHFDLAADLPAIVGDAAQLRQVLMNLIVNGAEAVGDAEGEIHLRSGIVEIDVAASAEVLPASEFTAGTYIFFEAADTGCGMDEATLRRIFEPFFSTKFTGRGLGLAATIGILRSHQGGIRVRSSPGHGSVFTIFLPPAPAEAAAAAAPAAGAKPAVAAPSRVLVIDDEAIVRRVVQRQLERAGYSVVLARDGREAVRLVAEQPDIADVVLLDLTMPDMGGEEVMLYLRHIGFRKPILVISGHDEIEIAAFSKKFQVHSFVQKPFSGDALVKAVREAIAAHAPA